jgi:hypothetical protein
MKLRIGGLMVVLFLLALAMTASGGALSGANPGAAVASLPPPYTSKVVARVELKGQSRNIPNTTIFTTGNDGLFRVSAYMIATAASNGDELGLGISYSDELGPTSQSFLESLTGPGCSGGAHGNSCAWVSTMRAVAGSPISYSQFGSGQVTYDLFFTVERLQ